jgi:Cu2+-exporting ATPase
MKEHDHTHHERREEKEDTHKGMSHQDHHQEHSGMPGHEHMHHEEGAVHEHHEHEKDMEHGSHTGHGSHQGHDHSAHHAHMVADFRKRFFISLAITIPVLALSPMIQQFLGLADKLRFPGDTYVLFALSSIIFFYGGWPFLKGLVDEVRKKRPGMMTLIGLAITVAYVYSSLVVFVLEGKLFFWELATLIDVMLLGHWIEMRSIMGASKALEELAKLMPSEAHRLKPDGSLEDVPLNELTAGDKVVVKPGEKIPADGVVLDGDTSVNEAMLTGESKPVTKSVEDEVIGGSINGEGSITVEVRKTGEDSFLSQVINLVRQAQASKSRTQDLASRAALILTIVAIVVGGITMFVWLGILNKDFAFALERTVTVMVITCPHALGLAVPLVVAVSTAISAKNGLLIRNRSAFERARKINAIIFDKTGTLTRGEFGVTDTVSFDDSLNEAELLKYAAAVENLSEHPIAHGIVTSVEDPYRVDDFKAIPGKGAQGVVNGKDVMVVSPGYLAENRIETNDVRIDELHAQGKTS